MVCIGKDYYLELEKNNILEELKILITLCKRFFFKRVKIN
jgi:hypothetical protein